MDGTFTALGQEVGTLVDTKQRAYGDSFSKAGDVFRILYPSGISSEQIDDALCLVRIFDKMMRIATNPTALGESPYADIAGYALLGLKRMKVKGENSAVLSTMRRDFPVNIHG